MSPPACRCEKKRVLPLALGTLVTCRSENCRFSRLPPNGIDPFTKPALETCWCDTRCTLLKRPCSKSLAPTEEMPFRTRAFLYMLVMFTLLMLVFRLK